MHPDFAGGNLERHCVSYHGEFQNRRRRYVSSFHIKLLRADR